MRKLAVVTAYMYTLLVIVASLGRFVLGMFPKGVAHSDKIAHFIAYAGFSLVWSFYFFKAKEYSFLKSVQVSLLWSIFFGVLMEFCQWFFTNYRQFDYYDMLANSFGTLIGLLIFKVFFVLMQKRQL